MKPRKESDIKRAIEHYLTIRGHLVIPFRNVGIMTKKKGWIPVRNKGVADLLVCTKEGRFVAIEVKRIGGRPTPEQVRFLDNVEKHNAVAFVAWGIEDAQAHGL